MSGPYYAVGVQAGLPYGVQVFLYEIDDSSARAAWADTTAIYFKQALPPETYALKIAFAYEPPPGTSVRVYWRTVQRDLQTIWVGIPQVDDTVEFIPLTTTRNPDGAYWADVPTAAFGLASGSMYEATLVASPLVGRTALLPPDTTITQGCPLPTCVVTRYFSETPVHHPLLPDRPHFGVDLAAAEGTPIRATAAGMVEESRWTGSTAFGNMIVIRDDSGGASLYGHLSAMQVFRGQQVTAGQQIGLVGHTGIATRAHLHYEYVKNGPVGIGGKRVDPLSVMVYLRSLHIGASQTNLDGFCCYGTENVIMVDGVTKGVFYDHTPGSVTVPGFAPHSVHTVRLGYQSGPWPQTFPGGYWVDSSIEGGTWTRPEGVDSPVYDRFLLTPNWWAGGLCAQAEGCLYQTYTVTLD